MGKMSHDEEIVQHVARAIAAADGDHTVMDHHMRRAEAAIKAVREMDAQDRRDE